MSIKTELYESFARLTYSIAMADGVVEQQEKAILKKYASGHPIEAYLDKYFNNPTNEVYSLVENYKELLEVCKENGPDEEYAFLVGLLSIMAENGDNDEDSLISSFLDDLKDRLLN